LKQNCLLLLVYYIDWKIMFRKIF